MDDDGATSELTAGTKPWPSPIFGNVCLRGRDAALAKGGKRGCCDGMQGLGPQLVSGEKKGDVGERRPPSVKVEEPTVLSERQLARDVALSE